MWHSPVTGAPPLQDLFGNEKGKAQQIDSKRSELRSAIRRIHTLIVSLPSQADESTREVAERIKRAKATALNQVASELNRQEISDLQAKAHRGAYPCPSVFLIKCLRGKGTCWPSVGAPQQLVTLAPLMFGKLLLNTVPRFDRNVCDSGCFANSCRWPHLTSALDAA